MIVLFLTTAAVCHLRADILQPSDTFALFPGWLGLGFSSNKGPLVHTVVQSNLQEYAVCCPWSWVTLCTVPRPCPTFETFFSGELPKIQKQLLNALSYLMLCAGVCLQPMSLHVCISPAAPEWAVCKHKGRYFLPGQFSLGDDIVGEGRTIHILDAGQRLLHPIKNKFCFRWTFHSLYRLNASCYWYHRGFQNSNAFKVYEWIMCCVLCHTLYNS